MSRVLPAHPSLEHVKKQAKELLHDFEQGDSAATEKLHSISSASARPKLADAQHVVALDYGFASWAHLKEHVESLTLPFDPVEAFVAAINGGEDTIVAQLLQKHSELKSKLNHPLPGFGFGGTALLAAVRGGNRKIGSEQESVREAVFTGVG